MQTSNVYDRICLCCCFVTIVDNCHVFFGLIFSLKLPIVTARKRSLGQGNIFSSVCQEFCSQGGLPQCMLEYHHTPPPEADPLGADTPRADTPPEQTTPQEQTPPPGADTPLGANTPQKQTPPVQCMLGYTVNK